MKRLGNRIDERFDSVFRYMKLKKTTQAGKTFFWPSQVDPKAYDSFRTESESGDRRSAQDLPEEEIMAAAKYVLVSQISLPKSELVREIARAIGYHRTGSALEKVIATGIDTAVKKGVVMWDAKQERVVDKG